MYIQLKRIKISCNYRQNIILVSSYIYIFNDKERKRDLKDESICSKQKAVSFEKCFRICAIMSVASIILFYRKLFFKTHADKLRIGSWYLIRAYDSLTFWFNCARLTQSYAQRWVMNISDKILEYMNISEELIYWIKEYLHMKKSWYLRIKNKKGNVIRLFIVSIRRVETLKTILI